MTVGFVMLAHAALHRAAEVAQKLADEGCPVVIHIDRNAPAQEVSDLAARMADMPGVTLADRRRCHWGTWSLVEASRDAAVQLLSNHPEIGHVMLISGACLPIKPVADLKAHLATHPDTDFIESVTVQDVSWTQGGLSEERFSYTFPFAWRRNRRLFDAWVRVQRLVGRKRGMPKGLEPHLGSQWWCLSRATLEKILNDPRLDEFDRYFRRVWIPDESYFQTLVRHHGADVESRSLTLSKFGFQGRPYVFYDDHLALLLDTPAFFARKIWPGSNRLYDEFLGGKKVVARIKPTAEGSFANRVFDAAASKRTAGRAGLAMAGRFPREGFENGVTAAPYAVLHGFGEVFEKLPDWVSRETGSCAHGNLFAPDSCHFANGETGWYGGLSCSTELRDYDPEAFLRNLIWNTRGEHQSFQVSASDNLDVVETLARDRNATVFAVTGAWALSLLDSTTDNDALRREAARLQNKEEAFIQRLQERRSLAHCHFWTLADVLERPSEPLQQILDALTGADTRTLTAILNFRPMDGLPDLLQDLKNAGMNPYLAGDVSERMLPVGRDTSNVIRLR